MTTRMSPDHLAFFAREGYLVLPDLFAPAEMEPLRREIAAVVDGVAERLQADGRLPEPHTDAPFETRLARLVADAPEQWEEYRRAIEGRAGGGHAGREMFALLTYPRLLDVMEDLLGPEIVGSSVYRIRPKLPSHVRGEVPWHQDSGYFMPHCDGNLIVTCWLPLVDATVENGCLYVLPRAHRQGVVTHHTGGPGGYLVIGEDDLPRAEAEAIPVPVPLGGMLLLSNLTPHCSRTNATDAVRWSVDLRYQGRDAPSNAHQQPEEFDASAPPHEIACYPPEGDFVVRSRRDPATVHTYEQFAARRAAYEAHRVPGPQRGWTPVDA